MVETEEIAYGARAQRVVDAVLVLLGGRAGLRRWFVALLCVEAVLLGCHVTVTRILAEVAARTRDGHIGVFDLDAEGSLGTWFSSVQLLALAAVCWALSWCDRAAGKRRWGWRLGAVLFLFMSLDETAVIHETFGGLMKRALPAIPLSASGWWSLPYAAGLGAVGLFVGFRLRGAPRLLLTAACAGACWVVAVSFEHVHVSAAWFNTLVEEGLEMVGATVLLAAMVGLLMDLCGRAADGSACARPLAGTRE